MSKKRNKSNRSLIVLTTLVGSLTLTSALLLALAPKPLAPDAATSLFALDAPQTLDVVFQTRTQVTSGRWKYILVRHSKTLSGNALTLAQSSPGGLGDHFVIGNGDGAIDGEIQIGQRWNGQTTAAPPPGASSIDPACVTICLIGDFDRTLPTPTQMRRLTQLLNTLQTRLKLPASHIMMAEEVSGPAGIGRYFPGAALRAQLLP